MNKGFTLAEVLITLGIIGIVAAMTIPNLINNYQKHVIETNLKETYSILQQVMKFTEYDDVALEKFPDSQEGTKQWFTTYLQPHLKYSSVCYNKAGCWQAKGPTRNLAGAEATYNQTGIGVGYSIVTIKLTNGANLCLDGYRPDSFMAHFGISTDNDSLAVYIDANGDNPPNVIGKDIFIVGFTEKGLVPAGQNKTVAEINKNCSGTATGMNAGYFCLMKVKNHGWEIPNDVWKIKI